MLNKIMASPVISITILAVLCGYLFFFQLGSLALTDPDETFYAQTAKEMLAKGEWSTPYLYGKPQFEKPVLFYWLVEASFKAFGVNEFSARLPSAAMALAGIIAIYFLGSIFFNKRVGFFSAFILATNVEYIVLSRACVTDMTLTAFMLIGTLFFFVGHLKNRRYGYILSSAAFALAILTKGPVALLLPAVAIITYLILIRDIRSLAKIPVLECAATFAAIALPWYILMYKLHGSAFIGEFFGFRNITRFLESEHKIGSQWYYNIPVLLGGFFPWSVFLPAGLWRIFKKALNTKLSSAEERKKSIFILVWFFVIFLFFTASSTKLPTYIFPCFISLALMTAVFWDDFLKGEAGRAMNISYSFLILIAMLGSAGVLIYIYIDYPVILGGAAVSAAALVLGIAASLFAFLAKRFIWSFLFIVYAVIIFLYPLDSLIIPDIERYETSKEISGKLLSFMKPGEALGAESNYLAGLAFYTGSTPVDLDKHHNLINFVRSEDRVWFVLKEKNHRQMYELDTKPYCTIPSYMVYKIGKRAIITNRVPDDGKYLVKRERNK